MSQRPLRSSVSRRAQRLLEEDDTVLSSSDSSPDKNEIRPKKSKTLRKLAHHSEIIANPRQNEKTEYIHDNLKTNKTLLEKNLSQKNKTSIGDSEKRHLSRNRSCEGRTSATKTHKKTDDTSQVPSCQKEKYLLKHHVEELQETVVKQGKKLKNLYKKIVDKRQEVNKLTEQLIATKQKTGIVLELEEKVKSLEEKESHLMSHLKDQQKVAKEALSKLYELQEDSMTEIEKAKQYYKDYYQKQVEEQKEQYEEKLRRSEVERERLMILVKDLEFNLTTEKSYARSPSVNSELAILKSQLNEKLLENERLKFENKSLKQTIEENKKLASMEIKDLRYEIETLNEYNRNSKTNEEDNNILYANMMLKKSLEEMEQKLHEKDKLMHEKDATYRDQVGQINQKVLNLQNELQRLNEYEDTIEKLNKEVMFKNEEIHMIKKYYKEKLQKAKIHQKEQKSEWAGIYNELVAEIKQMKNEIDALGLENKRLISSIRTKSVRDSY